MIKSAIFTDEKVEYAKGKIFYSFLVKIETKQQKKVNKWESKERPIKWRFWHAKSAKEGTIQQ